MATRSRCETPSLLQARRLARSMILAGAVIAVLAACGDDGSPTDPPTPEPVASVTVNPEVIELVEGGTIALTATPRAADGAALTGRTIDWTTSDGSVATVSSDGVVTAVAPGGAIVTATVEGVSATATSTVILSRTSVADIVRTEVIAPAWDDRFVLGLVTPTPLGAGTVVGTTATEASEGSETVFTLERSAYFAFVDLVPTHLFEHPALYVLVDAQTGEVTQTTRFLPPAIAGVPAWPTFDGRIGSPDRFEPASDNEPLKPVIPISRESVAAGSPHAAALSGTIASFLSASRRAAPMGQQGGQKRAFSISGGDDAYFAPSRDDMSTVLRRFGFDVTEFNSTEAPLADVTRDILEQTSTLGPDDEVVIYLIGHGGTNGFYYGHEQATNSRRWLYRTGPGGLSMPENSLPAFLQAIPAGRVTLILDTCHAGALQQAMDQQGFKPRPGVTLEIFASAKTTESARGPRTGETMLDFVGLGGVIEYRAQYTEGVTENIQGDTHFAQALADAHQTQRSLAQKPPFPSRFATLPLRTVFTTTPALIDIYSGQTFTIEGSTEWDDGSTTPATFELATLPPGVEIISDSFLEDRRRLRFRGLRPGDVHLRLDHVDRGVPKTEVVPVTIRPVQVSQTSDARSFEQDGETRTIGLPLESFRIRYEARDEFGCPSLAGGFAIRAEASGDRERLQFSEFKVVDVNGVPGCEDTADAAVEATFEFPMWEGVDAPRLDAHYTLDGQAPAGRSRYHGLYEVTPSMNLEGVPLSGTVSRTGSTCGPFSPATFPWATRLGVDAGGNLQLIYPDATVFAGTSADASSWTFVSPPAPIGPAHFTVETVLADPIRFGRTPTGGIVIDFAADSEAAVYQNVDGARVCAEQARIGSQTAELREFLRQFFD